MPTVGPSGSRFAALEAASKPKKEKSKKGKEDQEKPRNDDESEGKAKKEKKSKKERSSTKEGQELTEPAEEANGTVDLVRQRTDLRALFALVVARLQRGFEQFSRRDCADAAEWLGLDLEAEDIAADRPAEGTLGKRWPRMLKHLASAIEEGQASPARLAELWDLGSRLGDEAVRCPGTERLQAALERRFDNDSAFRELVQVRQARRKNRGRQPAAAPTAELLEPDLAKVPLALMGQPPALSRPEAREMPEAIMFDEARRSFAFVFPRLLPEDQCRRFFDLLQRTTPWHPLKRPDGSVKRSTCWHTFGGCRCEYTYGSERVGVASSELKAKVFEDGFQDLTRRVFRLARPDWAEEGFLPNCANLNLYEDGSQTVGWHADDESLFGGATDDTLIVSLSLGATREFQLAPRLAGENDGTKPDADAISWAALEDGDLATMEGLCQKHYLHAVPGGRDAGPRINVTWRWIRDHKRHCPLHRSKSSA